MSKVSLLSATDLLCEGNGGEENIRTLSIFCLSLIGTRDGQCVLVAGREALRAGGAGDGNADVVGSLSLNTD